MFLQTLCCVIFISTVYGAGEFSILHHPSSIIFKGHDHVKQSTLKEIYSASLGFSTEHYSNWKGIYLQDPFNLAEALVTVVVDGVSDIGQQKGHHFPLRTDEEDTLVFRALEKRVSEHYPESNTHLVRIDLANGLDDIQSYDIFKDIKNDKPKKSAHNHLKLSIDEDREFLKEMALLNSIADKIEQGVVKRDYVPDVFWFRVTSLHALSDLYGENATTTKEAKLLLNDAILRINAAFTKAYKGSVLVNVITSDASHTRRTRSILQVKADTPTDDKSEYNLAGNYNKDYPVVFNIILWFGVIMAFSLLAICLAIGNMDPGRDSIIYRMTSTRMKKDN